MTKYLITLTTAAAFLVGCEQRNVEQASKEFNQLPPAVQRTVRAQAPDAEIADVEQKTKDGVTIYEVQFRDKERYPGMTVAADGMLVRYEAGTAAMGKPGPAEGTAKGTASSLENQVSALPMSVQKAIQANAPKAEVVDIRRKEENGKVFYEIEYAGGKDRKPTLHVAADGHILKLPAEEAKPEKRD